MTAATAEHATAHKRPPAHADRPWWTPADQAELDLLIHELVTAARSHAARAPGCCRGDLVRCDHFAQVIQHVLDWREHRTTHSFALWLRALQNWRDQ